MLLISFFLTKDLSCVHLSHVSFISCPLFQAFTLFPLFYPLFTLSLYYSLPCGSTLSWKSIPSVFFLSLLLFLVYILYSLPYCLWLPSAIWCVRVKWVSVFLSLSFSFNHFTPPLFLILCAFVYMCAHTHMAENHLAFKQMYDDSTWRGPVIWASEPRMSLVPTCVGYSSPLFLSFFFLIYLSHTLQAVAAGWQSARAHILLK